MEKAKKIKTIAGAVLIVSVLLALIVALVRKYTPNDSMMALNEYYVVDDGEAMVILENTVYEERALLTDGGIYLSAAAVQQLINGDFYLDEEERVLCYTLPEAQILAREGEAAYTENGSTRQLTSPALLYRNGRYFLSMEFTERFSNMTFQYYEDPNRLVVQYQWVEFLYFDTLEEAPLRCGSDIKDEILLRLPAGTRLYYVSGTGTGGKSFIRVMTQDGVYGYVQRKFLGESYYLARESGYQEPEYTHLTMEEPVRLGWNVITVPAANDSASNFAAAQQGMNVISPTWYRLADEEGGLISLADASYVERAHALGLSVWALVDNFDRQVDCYALLSSTAARAALIENLIGEARRFGFDGINIDFETLTSATGPHYIQFLKELSAQCRRLGLVLSVDNYVPAPYNEFYDLKTQGKIVDYVVIMAYDEHYSGSSEAGSVASIGFVKDAVNNTLARVPRERIVIGVPFYTRLWKETEADGQTTLSSEALTMSAAEKLLAQNGTSAEWDTASAQYYASYEADGATYRIWLEEEESLSEKLQVISDGGVAGVAAWRLGFEKEGIWERIVEYLP